MTDIDILDGGDFSQPDLKYPLPLNEVIVQACAQDAKYGKFTPDIAGARLAVAVLEDEVAEVRDAWREERRIDGWAHMREEALQVAAVALRLAAALDGNEGRPGA